jgi:ribonuclease P protein component
VSKKFGSAVKRNLFKRRVREVFRAEKERLEPGLCIHVSPRGPASVPTLAQVREDFNLIGR